MDGMGTLTRYLEEAMARARYELIADEEPYYGEVSGFARGLGHGEEPEGVRGQPAGGPGGLASLSSLPG